MVAQICREFRQRSLRALLRSHEFMDAMLNFQDIRYIFMAGKHLAAKFSVYRAATELWL
jgi:hypothetical protein